MGRMWLMHIIPRMLLDVVVVGMAEASESHDHQLDEEEDKDCHEANALNPRVLGYGSIEAFIG